MKNKRQDGIDGYLYALDGIRALSLILIYIFHLWQQSWISYNIKIDGKVVLNLELWQRYGYIALESFFVLSGFCLFYPVAMEMFGEKKHTPWKQFYIKRARRIIPAYYFALLVFIIFPPLSYAVSAQTPILQQIKHYGLHALFLHIYNNSTAGSTVSTAWTLGIEAAFYVFFPFIAKVFRKNPIAAFAGMFVIGQGARLFSAAYLNLTQVVMSCPISYIDIFGIGMLSAYFVVYARHKLDMEKLKWFMTALSVLFIVAIWYYIRWMGSVRIEGYDSPSYHRLMYRFIADFCVAALLFTSVYSVKLWSKTILGNRVFRFLSTISYSFYLWHQNIHIMLKELKIPPSYMNPVMKDRHAMIIFSILSITISLAVAVFSTYVIERPFVKYGFGAVAGKLLPKKVKKEKNSYKK